MPVLAGFLSGDLKISRVNRGSPGMCLSADDIFLLINIENGSFRGEKTLYLMKNVCYLSEQVLKIKYKINVKMREKKRIPVVSVGTDHTKAMTSV